MASRVGDETAERISNIMFKDFSHTAAERFLRQELERYIPQFSKASDDQIKRFIEYQRNIYIYGFKPSIGQVIACLNPKFIDSIDDIKYKSKDLEIYTRASTKENGYRLQLHLGPRSGSAFEDVSAFSRQFTAYDLRMFPELRELFTHLPVMVGDSELVNKHFTHMGGFNRVDKRIPDANHWPRSGQQTLPDEFIDKYLSNPKLFKNSFPLEEFEMTLAFHGMFAIAHPDTWERSREEQLESMISLCNIPMNYKEVDKHLDLLSQFIEDKKLNARIVERKVVNDRKQLQEYVEEKEKQDLEGVCVVQFAQTSEGEPSLKVGKSFKIKKYETFDLALVGLYLKDRSLGLKEDNVSGAVLGLYDERVSAYVPALKVNLDPDGIQVKEIWQKDHLTTLRNNIVNEAKARPESQTNITKLYDLYLLEGGYVIRGLLNENGAEIEDQITDMLDTLPRGKNLIDLIRIYQKDIAEFDSLSGRGNKASSTMTDKFIYNNKNVFEIMTNLVYTNSYGYKRFIKYFSRAKEMKNVSQRLQTPQYLVDTSDSDPIILETKVFNIKFSLNPFPAGYHSWYSDSFNLTNVFAERLRHDKQTTTDYATITEIAMRNTPKKRRKKK